jgi:hypothetical protein
MLDVVDSMTSLDALSCGLRGSGVSFKAGRRAASSSSLWSAASSRRSQPSEMSLYSRSTRTLEMRGSPCGTSLLMCVDIDDDLLDVGHGHGRRAV